MYYKLNKELLNKLYNITIGKHKRYKVIVYANETFKSDEEIKQMIYECIPEEKVNVIIKRK